MFGLLCFIVGSAAAGERLTAPDGVALNAEVIQSAEATQGILLLHMEGRTAADWASFSDRVSKNGVTTVALELRGHGQSGGEIQHDAMVGDVRTAIDWLAAQNVENISCVGAELGANLCLLAAAEDERLSSVVLLSPRLNPHGLNAPRAMQEWSAGASLIVASTDDASGSRCVDLLARVAGEERAEVVILADAGVGTQMLSRSPGLESRLSEWLTQNTLNSADVSGIRPDTTDTTTVEAEGEKLRTHQ